jgi:hypothetical protein
LVRKTRVALVGKGIEYKRVPLNPFVPTPELMALSPLGRLPVLRDEHVTLPDSSCIIAYLERRYAGEPYRLASQHFVWVGEGWARQPDGGMKLCHARVMAIRDARARVVAYAESYHAAIQDQSVEQEVRDLLYGVRRFEPTGTPNERLAAIRDELRTLSEGFRDLDHVIRQFEKLLPSLSANDPLTESIAGPASDVRAAVSAVGMTALLEEIPLALARLRAHVQRFESDAQDATDPAASKPREARTGVEKRSA